MAIVSRFYDSVSGDRVYTSADLSGVLARLIAGDGVRFGYANQMAVSPGTALDVAVATGAAFVQGRYVEVTAAETLALAAADATNPRIDRVVVRIDLNTRAGSVAVLTGTPAATPAAPALTRDGTVWELSLAQVYVAAGATTIAAGNITDERADDSVCGYTPRGSGIIHRGTQRDLQGLDALIDGILDPTTGHAHTGAAGDAPKIDPGAFNTAAWPAFRAYQSTLQSIAAATWTKVAFQTEEFDQGGVYDAATYEFIAPVDGIYLFGTQVSIASALDGEAEAVSIYKNGVEHSRLAQIPAGAGGDKGLGGATPLKLVAGDRITVYVNLSAARDTRASAQVTYFTAVRVA